jgi:tight adherence protein C
MKTLLGLWSAVSGNLLEEPLVLVVAVGAATFLLALGLLTVLAAAANPARRRLATLIGTTRQSEGGPAVAIATAVRPFARFLMPRSSKERDSMEQRFAKAGFSSPNAMPVFYGVKTLAALTLLAIWMLSADMLPKLTTSQVVFYGVLCTFVGLMLPNFVLDRLITRRQRALRNAFPDALDLLIVCVESGLGLVASLQRVAGELQVSHPELAGELARINAEIGAGMERDQALRNLADRTGLEDIRGLVSLLIQSLRFGTSIADALRVYSEEFRDKRMQRAEEIAATLGTKMIFPLIFCFFPSFFLVAVGPAVIRVIQAFAPH